PSRPLAGPPFAFQDREAFHEARYFPGQSEPPFPAPGRDALLQELAALQTLDPLTQSTAVVWLCGLARTDQAGPVLVFLPHPNPASLEEQLPLREVLGQLASCPVRHKLLILDVTAPFTDARIGVLASEVAAGVQRDVEAVPDAGRLVLCPCAPGQVAFASED